jgi:excisionase family DNA binding protein
MTMATQPIGSLALRPREAAKALGISPRLLWQLTHDGVIPCVRVGGGKRRTVLYPVSNDGGHVLGIRLRLADGRKLSVRGGREGLFLPSNLAEAGLLLICEGPTDTAAMLDLGFAAVGRPSCAGGVRLLVDLVRQRPTAEAVIVADADAHGHGQRGAENLAAMLVAYSASVRVIKPAAAKDAREWLRCGATRTDVLAAIGAAAVRRLPIQTRKVGNHASRP